MSDLTINNSRNLALIRYVSIAIPVVVAILLFIPTKIELGNWVKILPHVIAGINITTSFVLALALVAIKLKKINLHKTLMFAALGLGAIFLVTYVIYHASVPSTVFGDINHNGVLDPNEADLVKGTRGIYLFFLLSHIGLSIIVLPLVLMAFYFALGNQIGKHKKIVKFTYPIWMYVSVTGVVIYYLISPFYK